LRKGGGGGCNKPVAPRGGHERRGPWGVQKKATNKAAEKSQKKITDIVKDGGGAGESMGNLVSDFGDKVVVRKKSSPWMSGGTKQKCKGTKEKGSRVEDKRERRM